jgi:hypothetical protein
MPCCKADENKKDMEEARNAYKTLDKKLEV